MRVLVLSWNYPPVIGGIEAVVENLFHGLRRSGHEVLLVTSFVTAAPGEPGLFRASKGGLKPFLWYSLCKGMSLCQQFKPNLIVCGSIVTAPAAIVLTRLFRLPFLVLVHGKEIVHDGWWYQRVVRWLLRRPTRLVANSAQTKSLLERSGFDGHTIDVIHPGISVVGFTKQPDSQADHLLEQISNRRVLLSVGRLVRRKGLLEFVEFVMPGLTNDYPDILLLIIGEDATDSLAHRERLKARIAARASDLGLAHRVWLLGAVPSSTLVHLYFRADIFVLPCLDVPGDVEGFGLVLLEAALAGTPTVATPVGGIPEAVEDGKTGLLVEPGDFHGMRRAISTLLDDEQLRQRMGEAGKDRVKRLFDVNATVSKYEQVFARCIQAGM